MQIHKTLFIGNDDVYSNDLFLQAAKAITFPSIVKNRFFRMLELLLRFLRIYHINFFPLLFNIPLKQIKNVEYTIMIDALSHMYMARLIKHCFPDKKLIIYYVNPILKKKEYKRMLKFKKFAEIWSFDKKDCERCNLKLNENFAYCNYILPIKKDIQVIQDAFFCGKDKGRKEIICDLKRKLENIGLNVRIIVPEKPSQFLKFEEFLLFEQQSMILLDIVQQGQYGATQRELDSVFYKKKLITTNIYVKERIYYNPNNILIFNSETSQQELIEFIQKPLIEILPEILQFYSANAWINRFFEDIAK